MPSKSKKQHNLMAAVANSPAFAKKTGIPQSVGRDYMKADKGKKFGGGGMASCGGKAMAKGGITEYGGKERYTSKSAMMQHEKSESPMMERKEGMAAGGKVRGCGVAQKGLTKGRMV